MTQAIPVRTMAAMQFWIVDELVAGFLQVPFIDQLLMPVVFMLDRRIWAYSELISIGNTLIRLPRAVANASVWMPFVVQKTVGCVNATVSGSGVIVELIHWLLGTIQAGFSGPYSIFFVYMTLIIAGSISGLMIDWFWAGYVNHYLRRVYGWTFASSQFGLWEKGRRKASRFLRFDKTLRHRLHLHHIAPFWFWFAIGFLTFEVSLIISNLFFPYQPGNHTPSLLDCSNSLKT